MTTMPETPTPEAIRAAVQRAADNPDEYDTLAPALEGKSVFVAYGGGGFLPLAALAACRTPGARLVLWDREGSRDA